MSFWIVLWVAQALLFPVSDCTVTTRQAPLSSWNPAPVSATEVTEEYQRLCPFSRTCAGSKVTGEPLLGQPCCSPCSCDRKCSAWGDCCPDARSVPDETQSKPEVECTSVYDWERSTHSLSYLMIVSCSAEFKDSETIRKCREPEVSNLDENLPVWGNTTKDAYRNRYCAYCNMETDVIPWDAYIISSVNLMTHVLPISGVSDAQGVFNYSRTSGDDRLKVLFVPNGIAKQCHLSQIATCNVTGGWLSKSVLAASYKEACAEFHAPYMTLDLTIYKNVFCAVCNGETPVDECFLSGAGMTMHGDFVAAMAYGSVHTSLLYPPEEVAQSSICNSTQFLDPHQRQCRPWLCPHWSYDDDGGCRPVYRKVSGFTLLFLATVTSDSVILSELNTTTLKDLGNYVEKAVLPTEGVLRPVLQQISTFPEPSMKLIYMYTVSLEQFETSGDDYVNSYLRSTKRAKTLTIRGGNRSLHLTVSSADNILVNGRQYSVFYFPGSIMLKDLSNSDGCLLENLYVSNRHFIKGSDMVRVTKKISCVQAELAAEEYVLADSGNSLFVPAAALTLYAPEFHLDQRSRSVRICLDDYLRAAGKRKEDDASFSVTQLVSVSMTLLAGLLALFLAISYFTNACQRASLWSLRLVVSCHVLAAQTMYLICQLYRGNDTGCTTLGAVSHFLWLVVFILFHVCCFHIAKSLLCHDHTVSGLQVSPRTLAAYTVYAYLLASAIVSAQIAVSFFLNESRTFGYSLSHGVCFLADHRKTAWLLLGPGATSLLLCLCCYWKLRFTSCGSDPGSCHQSLALKSVGQFSKLCLVTLASWSAWVLYDWQLSEVCHYSHIALNGCVALLMVVYFCSMAREYSRLPVDSAHV